MSEELEWELYDIFEAGLFAFPLYEHQSARKIIRYLLYRGVLEEEIADAIEDSTIDLHIWLNRQGKNMVGEWVIAWVNDVRDEYLADRGITEETEGEVGDVFGRDRTISREHVDYTGGGGDAPDGGGGGGGGKGVRRRPISPASCSSEGDSLGSDGEETEVKRPLSPPPLPPRTLTLRHVDSSCSNSDSDHSPLSMRITRESFYERTPDSGAVSDIYSSGIPIDNQLYQSAEYLTNLPTDNITTCTTHNTKHVVIGAAGNRVCPNCQCTLAHYAYLNNPLTSVSSCHSAPRVATTPDSLLMSSSLPSPNTTDDSGQQNDTDEGTSDEGTSDEDMDTVEMDGPGYIFILTDSLENCLPWSSEHRYKVASSKCPDRCVSRFRATNISVELIWQVRVEQHLTAAREIHKCLNKYKLHTTWYKCSLSVIMDTISKTVRKYRSA